jgi:hypothetical protein
MDAMPDKFNPSGTVCVYCGKYCWTPWSKAPRFDGATLVATCPEGKVMDRAREAIAEAAYHVEQRKPPMPPNNDDDGRNNLDWPFMGY